MRYVVSVVMMQDVQTDTGKITKLVNDLWTESSFKFNNPEEAVRAALASSIVAHPDHELVMRPIWMEIPDVTDPVKEPQLENLGSALRATPSTAGRAPSEDG